jgi:ATP-binding cassette, subfamily B, bacterial
LTARENIQFGNADRTPDEERIVEAARHSGADAVISGLKQGYDTVLGKWFEGGEELSIGQWQKIALARAFLRESQIIVLDEPTSAMDAKAEYELFRQFRQLAAGRAAVLISHRFSTVRHADCIYVLEDGKIIESGSHEALMALNGTYARLFEMQAQHYR